MEWGDVLSRVSTTRVLSVLRNFFRFLARYRIVDNRVVKVVQNPGYRSLCRRP
jgi:site-specific recombinase XerD